MTKTFCDLCGAPAFTERPEREDSNAFEYNKQLNNKFEHFSVRMTAPSFLLLSTRTFNEDRACVSHLCPTCYNAMLERLRVKVTT